MLEPEVRPARFAPGQPVPPSTSGKATAAGTGAVAGGTAGGLIAAIATGWVLQRYGVQLSPDMQFNIAALVGIAGTAITGGITAAISAYNKRNYLL